MRKIKELKNKVNKKMLVGSLALVSMLPTKVFAATGDTDPTEVLSYFDKFMEFISSIITIFGGGLFFFGVVKFALAFQKDNSTAQTKALRFILSGAMVAVLGVTWRFFIL